jgi:hypothetical protein
VSCGGRQLRGPLGARRLCACARGLHVRGGAFGARGLQHTKPVLRNAELAGCLSIQSPLCPAPLRIAGAAACADQWQAVPQFVCFASQSCTLIMCVCYHIMGVAAVSIVAAARVSVVECEFRRRAGWRRTLV